MTSEDKKVFLEEYEKQKLPETFYEKYELLECLSQNALGETLLVRRAEGTELYICKSKYKGTLPKEKSLELIRSVSCKGIPTYVEGFETEDAVFSVRKYIEGESLQKILEKGTLPIQKTIHIAAKLCDILSCLHGQEPPIIHRDIKPSNVLLSEEDVYLIDFGISRAVQEEAEADTICFGTREYAPPEQYGFSQTDSRTDIYSVGILLCVCLTGQTKTEEVEDKVLRRIIKKCTALAPEDRYSSASLLKKDLLRALPEKRRQKKALAAGVAVLFLVVAVVGVKEGIAYSQRTIWPVEEPAYFSSQEQIAESAAFLNEIYDTDFFRIDNDMAGVGYLREALVQVFDKDVGYVNALPPDGAIPAENEAYFLPWGLGADESIHRDILTYVVVKTYWPEVVADWSGLKEDTGQYPGVRVANDFAEKNGLLEGMNKYDHLSFGEVAIVYANAERLAAKK